MPPSTAIPPKPFHLRPSTRSIPFIPSTSSHPVLYPDKHVNHKRKMSQRGYAVSKECPAAMNRHKNLARKARQDQNAHPEHAPNTRDEPPGTHAKSHTPAPPRKNTSAISHNWRIVAVAGERRRELRADDWCSRPIFHKVKEESSRGARVELGTTEIWVPPVVAVRVRGG